MLWIKAWHIIFMVTWFAGLFYLPRLFVYHAMSSDETSNARFKIMERKLFYGIMTPGAVLTIAFGLWLWLGYGFTGGWLHAKVSLVYCLCSTTCIAASSCVTSPTTAISTAMCFTAGLTKLRCWR